MPIKNPPLYRCHKEVRAFKIGTIRPEEMPRFQNATCRGCFALGTACGNCERCAWERTHGPAMGAILVPADSTLGAVEVGRAFMGKHEPRVGGYYVIYEDGYQSFSPAEAFESGYTRIG